MRAKELYLACFSYSLSGSEFCVISDHYLFAGRSGVLFLKNKRFRCQLLQALVLSSVAAPVFSQNLPDAAARQINDVLTIKRSLNKTQRKLSSSLILGAMAARNQTAAGVPRALFHAIKTETGGLALIDLKTTSTATAERQIAALGGEVVYSSGRNGAIRARLSILNLEALAQLAEVQSIRPATPVHKNGLLSARLLRSRSARQFSLVNSLHLAPFLGSITSQGFVAHAANQVVPGGIDGTGVRVGVLSDSALPDRVAALIASGDLPADVTVVPGQEGPSDGENEGTAMMEIVHDLAPGAKLFFASAYAGEDSFANNIRILRNVYGCDIIVDDVTYADEPAFQDGIVAQAVNDVTASGALYFSAAGNLGNVTYGTSGTWEGDFKDGGDAGTLLNTVEGKPVRLHDFGASGTVRTYNVVTSIGSWLGLHWSDPTGHSNNDYDLFVFDSTGTTLKAASFDTQTGSQDPFELVYEGENCGTATASGYCAAPGDRVVVVLYNGAARALHIDSAGGRLAIATSGASYGHNAGLNTISMAATAWNSASRRHASVYRFRESDRELQFGRTPEDLLQSGRIGHYSRQLVVLDKRRNEPAKAGSDGSGWGFHEDTWIPAVFRYLGRNASCRSDRGFSQIHKSTADKQSNSADHDQHGPRRNGSWSGSGFRIRHYYGARCRPGCHVAHSVGMVTYFSKGRLQLSAASRFRASSAPAPRAARTNPNVAGSGASLKLVSVKPSTVRRNGCPMPAPVTEASLTTNTNVLPIGTVT